MPLNPRQLRFVAGYLDGSPASAAYRAAGYRCRTDRSAEAKASALLRTPAVAAAVEAGRLAAAAKAGLSAERVVAGLLAEATYFGPGTSHAARVSAWTTLARHLGLLRDKVELSGRAGGAAVPAGQRPRPGAAGGGRGADRRPGGRTYPGGGVPLNPRQQKFVVAYLAGATAAAAYRGAGYACRTAHAAESKASALLRSPAVVEAIAEVAEKAGLTAEWVTRRLMVEATREGDGASHAARVRALELLGRRFGLFAEQVEVSGPAGGPVPLDLTRLSDDHLRQLDAILAAAETAGGPPPAA